MVAESNESVVGYLLGSASQHFDLLLVRCGLETVCKMILRLISGRYSEHPRSKQFIRWLLTTAFSEQPRHPRKAAHLHLDLDKHYRGRGVGRALWAAYQKRLEAAGIRQCYGAFFSHPGRRPELAYVRYGFKVFDRRRTTLFAPDIPSLVEVVCVSKVLGE